MLVFGVSFGDVSVAECTPLGNSCSLGRPYVLFCILTFCNISYFPFWF